LARTVTIEAVEAATLLAAIPDVAVLRLSEPVVRAFDEITVFAHLIANHDASHIIDQLGLVQHFDLLPLRAAAKLPLIPDSEWKVAIRMGEVGEVRVEQSRLKLRIITTLS
jgi:hypothetical protein